MFDIFVENPDKTSDEKRINVFQNSWGLSTRTIGVMVMVHGDDQGLVIPPRVALQQVVIVPVGLSKAEGKNDGIYNKCLELERELVAAGIRAKADTREGYTPGWKFNDWELRVSGVASSFPSTPCTILFRISASEAGMTSKSLPSAYWLYPAFAFSFISFGVDCARLLLHADC